MIVKTKPNRSKDPSNDALRREMYDISSKLSMTYDDRLIEYVLYRLRGAGLRVDRIEEDESEDVILIKAPFAVLLREAERIGLKKKLTESAVLYFLNALS